MAVVWKKLARQEDVIAKALLTAAGDIIYASAASTPARLAKGANGQVLTLAAGLPSWAAAAGGATLTVNDDEVFSGTCPTAWTDLDLSGTIGSNVALCLLKFVSAASTIMVGVRRNGDTDEFYSEAIYPSGVAWGMAAGEGGAVALLAAADSSGKIEWKANDALTDVTVTLIAYIK